MSAVQSALATLPISFPDPANVKIVDGSSGWPADVRRALDSGATAVVVLHPRPTEFADLLAAAAPVIVDSRWASNPVIDSAAPAFRAAESSRVECRVIVEPGSDFASALLDELMLIRALLGPVHQATVRYLSDHALYAEGSTDDGLAVDFSVVCTSAVPASATVRLLTSDGSVELTIPSGDTAQPARLITVGPDGAVLAPTLYETGHRAALRRLHGTAPADRLTDLRDLYDDVQVVLAAFRNNPRRRHEPDRVSTDSIDLTEGTQP
ncbi:hypothetical protein EV643_103254 [Kribbella sp. VKM Ac-2527]|uniref:Uncharacterized protein n=1 Tax=Kribbella caucasensis TaxID=2512215 RepID=A0A4R6KM97_9ACTN|nr:hypothetical protein [Kribbella sp. VKM Ac-2527]TDO51515.1 hypothetical protein EV643_103254 [Kribbella sp. VKM Ac-2527]